MIRCVTDRGFITEERKYGEGFQLAGALALSGDTGVSALIGVHADWSRGSCPARPAGTWPKRWPSVLCWIDGGNDSCWRARPWIRTFSRPGKTVGPRNTTRHGAGKDWAMKASVFRHGRPSVSTRLVRPILPS